MPYPECKIYFDGSHYIAIPHTEKRYRPRPKKKEEIITVRDGNVSVAESPCKGEQLIDEASAPQNGDTLLPLEKSRYLVYGKNPNSPRISCNRTSGL